MKILNELLYPVKKFSKGLLVILTVNLLLILSSLSCNKSDLNSNDEKTTMLQINQKINRAKQQAKNWYTQALKNIDDNKINYAKATINRSVYSIEAVQSDLVNDPDFVGLLYTTIDNSIDNYSYYINDLGEENYTSFVSAITNPEADPQQLFNDYEAQIDPLIDNTSEIFAQAVITLNNNPQFAQLTEEQQIVALSEAIAFYFPSTTGGIAQSSMLVNSTLPRRISPSELLNEIGGCLFDAVGGYLIGNVRIIRDIYGAISGSSMGYSFVYAMAGRIL